MKKIIVTIALVLLTPSAYADVYVKVDANGNAISGAIVCDFNTCGTDSEFTRLTLKEGERYALQSYGTVGVGNNDSNVSAKVDENNNWTITRIEPVLSSIADRGIPVTVETTERFNPVNPIDTESKVAIQIPTASNDAGVTENTTTETMSWDFLNWWEMLIWWFSNWYAEYTAITTEG
jgi:hypothetical protein